MFRSSARVLAPLLMLCASMAQADRILTRGDLEPILRDNATCYMTASNRCYSGEFYDIDAAQGGDAITITFAYYDGNDIVIVRERGFWRGDTICVSSTAPGVEAVWDLPAPDRIFRFDHSNATPRSGFEVALTIYDFARSRPQVYCYGFVANDTNTTLRSYFVDDAVPGGGAGVRFVPRSAGQIDLG